MFFGCILLISVLFFFFVSYFKYQLYTYNFGETGNSDEQDEKVKCPVVQQRGRFKVTSENVDLEKVTSISCL